MIVPVQAKADAASTVCDGACIRAASDRAVAACVPHIEAQAPLDFDWLNRPLPGIFQQAEQPVSTVPVVMYRGDVIRFQTAQKDWERMSYECGYDVNARKVVSIKIHPGRLPPHLDPVSASVILPGVQAQAAPRGTPVPAAPPNAQANAAGAVGGGLKVPSPRVGEPSPIEIQQQAPRVRP